MIFRELQRWAGVQQRPLRRQAPTPGAVDATRTAVVKAAATQVTTNMPTMKKPMT